jgi:hypothetical protein
MTAINLMTKEDVKTAVLEVLNQIQPAPPQATEPESYVYGLNELAAFLGIGVTTAWRIAKKLPKYHTGRKYFFKKSEVLKALETL